eukprot:SAG11_NODE_2157_length_3731_cov_10.095540_3_plen_78_part_00
MRGCGEVGSGSGSGSGSASGPAAAAELAAATHSLHFRALFLASCALLYIPFGLSVVHTAQTGILTVTLRTLLRSSFL